MAEPTPIYLDPSYPREERVRDLLSRLTLQEKISLMPNQARAVPRLGIPAYDYWSEALHGVARNGKATVFPQAIGLGATWDSDLLKRVATAISDEGRAKYHSTLKRRGAISQYAGLHYWSPNLNLNRSGGLWGRGQETYGEDPCLIGELGVAFIKGLQGDDPRYLKQPPAPSIMPFTPAPKRYAMGLTFTPQSETCTIPTCPPSRKQCRKPKLKP
jgi:beta-glucosidase